MCDVVLCGGVTCETQGELCDRMGIEPNGLVFLYGLEPAIETCLCTVDIVATAERNGFTAARYYDQVADWVVTPNGEVRGASRLAGEASSAEGATSTVLLGATARND